jgi:hypothetical protein
VLVLLLLLLLLLLLCWVAAVPPEIEYLPQSLRVPDVTETPPPPSLRQPLPQ